MGSLAQFDMFAVLESQGLVNEFGAGQGGHQGHKCQTTRATRATRGGGGGVD